MDEPKIEEPELEPTEEPEATEEPEHVEEPEPTEEPEPIEEPEPDEEQAAERRETIAVLEGLEKEATRHEKALQRILGKEATANLCTSCEGVGYLPPGEKVPEQPTRDPDARLCELCLGWGVLATGSINPGNETRPCSKCGGRGYVEKLPDAMPEPATLELVTVESDGFGVPPWMGDPALRPAAGT